MTTISINFKRARCYRFYYVSRFFVFFTTLAAFVLPNIPASAQTAGTGSASSIQPLSTAPTSPTPAGTVAQPGPLKQQESSSPFEPPQAGETVTLENADLLRIDDQNRAEATGNVRVKFRDYTLYSDHATINTQTGTATFDGHVRLESEGQLTHIEGTTPSGVLLLNMNNGHYAFSGAQHAVIDPNLLEGSELQLPLIVNSTDISSSGGIIDARKSGFTTCDFAHPHYNFGVSSLIIVPGKHIIARHAILYRRGKRLFEISKLVLPIDNRYGRSNYIPTVGESQEEGYFAKFAIPYALTAVALGIIRIDLLQKQGVGEGFSQSYYSHGQGGGGTFTVYRLYDQSRGLSVFTNSLTHAQTLGDFRLNVTSNFQNNSYYSSASASQNLSTTATLTRSNKYSSTELTTNVQQSDYGAGLSRNINGSLVENERLNKTDSADLKLDYAGYLSPSFEGIASSQRSTIDANLGLHFQPSGLRLDVQTNTFNSLQNTSGLNGSYGGLEKRPELMLSTTGTGEDPLDRFVRLVHGSSMQIGFGSYFENATNTDTNRTYFGYDLGNQIGKIGAVQTSSEAAYQQSFYGDGGAQYILNGHYNTTYRSGPILFGANYTTLRAYGFTPFLFDRTGEYNSANLNMGITPNKNYDLTAATSYDFTQDQGVAGAPAEPWQDLLAIFNLHPSVNLNNRAQTTYDLNHGRLFDVSDTFLLKNNAGVDFQTSFDYSPPAHKFGTVNGSLDLPIILDQREQSGYKVSVLAGYNGYSESFTYRGFSLTRSWHDWELTGTYQDNPTGYPQGQSYYLTFHLKAFPAYQPFGVGGGGQSLATGIGQVY